ncbi:MAG: hypothetical protein ASARMPREDX12_002811 [Alectoria sarmentosa]|nr:MAG: hypothetical protein ASARMPREDX12_002811 [Alectoria sarmentosa]
MAATSSSLNAISTSSIQPDTRTKSWATKQDWIRHQTLIRGHYEKHTLAKVMQVMKSQHGFQATMKMYKTHLKEWGLDKKKKEEDMVAVACLNKKRRDECKASTFLVRGKVVDYADVVRYWKRKRISIDVVISQRAASTTPEAVECSTPVEYRPEL